MSALSWLVAICGHLRVMQVKAAGRHVIVSSLNTYLCLILVYPSSLYQLIVIVTVIVFVTNDNV